MNNKIRFIMNPDEVWRDGEKPIVCEGEIIDKHYDIDTYQRYRTVKYENNEYVVAETEAFQLDNISDCIWYVKEIKLESVLND